MFNPESFLVDEGNRYVEVDCPNCGKHDRTVREGKLMRKCDGCGYSDCDIVAEYVCKDEEWVEVENG